MIRPFPNVVAESLEKNMPPQSALARDGFVVVVRAVARVRHSVHVNALVVLGPTSGAIAVGTLIVTEPCLVPAPRRHAKLLPVGRDHVVLQSCPLPNGRGHPDPPPPQLRCVPRSTRELT